MTANTREQESGCGHVCGPRRPIPGGEDAMRLKDPSALGLRGSEARGAGPKPGGGASDGGGRRKAQ